nr:sulfite exporter TauE/SafE family protein [Acidobacteriota bacterium]
VVMSSAATSGRFGPWYLALGLSTAFAVAGTLLVLLLVTLGLDPELFRYVAAALLVAVAATLLVDRIGEGLSGALSRMIGAARAPRAGGAPRGPLGQFAVGALLGFVWLPCVGPTLGAAIALASLGQDMVRAFVIMFTFGAGTAVVLVAAGLISGRALARWRPGVFRHAGRAKRLMGGTLLVLAILVLSGADKRLEAWSLGWLPDWAVSI